MVELLLSQMLNASPYASNRLREQAERANEALAEQRERIRLETERREQEERQRREDQRLRAAMQAQLDAIDPQRPSWIGNGGPYGTYPWASPRLRQVDFGIDPVEPVEPVKQPEAPKIEVIVTGKRNIIFDLDGDI